MPGQRKGLACLVNKDTKRIVSVEGKTHVLVPNFLYAAGRVYSVDIGIAWYDASSYELRYSDNKEMSNADTLSFLPKDGN